MWDQIKRLLQKGGGRFIIIENEKPSYVVLPIEEYEELIEGGQIEKANQDISAWKATENKKIELIEPEFKKEEEIKVEDLPF